MGLFYMLYDRFYIQLYAKISSKRCCIGQDWYLCRAHLRCFLPGDFPLLECVHLGVSLCLILHLLGAKDSFLVFCLHRTSENGTLVQVEEPAVFPRVWVMLLPGYNSNTRRV